MEDINWIKGLECDVDIEYGIEKEIELPDGYFSEIKDIGISPQNIDNTFDVDFLEVSSNIIRINVTSGDKQGKEHIFITIKGI